MNGVTTGELSQRGARWNCNIGEDADYLRLDEKTPGALLYLDIGLSLQMRSIGGRLWSSGFGQNGVASEIPLFWNVGSNPGYTGRHYQVGSLSGALSTQRVTVEFIKVGYLPMEMARIG